MAIALIPDIEQIVADYLRGHPDVASLVEEVVTRTPDSVDTPWVRVALIASPAADDADHLISALMQFDCYAGVSNGREEASRLARTIRAVLVGLVGIHGNEHNGPAVITGVPPRLVSASRIPDDMLDPARERVVVTATVYAHGSV